MNTFTGSTLLGQYPIETAAIILYRSSTTELVQYLNEKQREFLAPP
ncbi:hypothetical protein K0C01_11160 [Salinarchaeum sp. IM2453]|nr:hypothetical protein [Salinarchaeum sp. IM2453]QZA88329.1 hypothetical protein K0C01_11160 [Salinarchaeum sp. IM2453]